MSTLNGGPGNIVTNGLVLYLDAANPTSYVSGSTIWRDLSFNNYTGSLVNNPTYSGSNGGTLNFNGTNNYCQFPVEVGNGYSQLTAEVLFVPLNLSTNKDHKFVVASGNSLTSDAIYNVFSIGFNQLTSTVSIPSNFLGLNLWFGVNTGPNLGRVRAVIDNSAWSTYLAGMAISLNNPNLAVGTPIHVTGVYNGLKTLLYVNGSLSAASDSQPDGVGRSTTGSLIFDTSSKSVGGDALDLPRGSNTRISTFRIYNRALSTEEVLQNYNSTKGRFGL